jgi:hypothetical protein
MRASPAKSGKMPQARDVHDAGHPMYSGNHLKRYRQIARLLWKYGRHDLKRAGR